MIRSGTDQEPDPAHFDRDAGAIVGQDGSAKRRNHRASLWAATDDSVLFRADRSPFFHAICAGVRDAEAGRTSSRFAPPLQRAGEDAHHA